MAVSKWRLILMVATILATFIVSEVECYPHQLEKRATGGVPQMDDRFIVNQRAQNLDTTAIANASLITSNGLSQVVSLLERLVANSEALIQSQSEQFNNMSGIVDNVVTSMAILQKGMRLTAGDCSDIANHGPYSYGIYKITPWDDMGYDGAFNVYCDMADDGGWTVIQRRMDGSVDFYLGWEDYKNGFGNLDGEFWLGLDKLYRLTNKTKLRWQLKVELEDFDGNTAYAEYDHFSIGHESINFQLTVGTYSGNAGGALAYQNNMPFTTKDRDNDKYSQNCASSSVHGGAWWHNTGCDYSNLNGPYLTSAQSTAKSIHWWHWKISYVALKKSQMKIKPVM